MIDAKKRIVAVIETGRTIENFINFFTREKIKYLKIGSNYYLDSNLLQFSRATKSRPYSLGLTLGRIENNKFFPSITLLQLISKKSGRKVFLNKKGAWLFVCGRDIFGSSVVKANVEEGVVLVQNEFDENLGYGKIVAKFSEKNRVVLQNILDAGDFLRRENRRERIQPSS